MKILTKHKGIAIEMTLVFMVVAFLLSFMLTSVMYSISISNRMLDKYQEQRLLFDYLGETFLQTKRLDAGELSFEGYQFEAIEGKIAISSVKGDGVTATYEAQFSSVTQEEVTTHTLTVYNVASPQEVRFSVVIRNDEIIQWIYA